MGGTEYFIASALMSGLGTAASISQARQQQKAEAQAGAIKAQQAQSDIAALQAQKAQAESDRQDRLARATAAQHAAFAASGVSSDGSADAVFGNLLNRSSPNYLGALAGFGDSLVSSAYRYKPDFLNPKPTAGGKP